VARIYFSCGLSQYTGGVESLDIDAPRVRELLEQVQQQFPQLVEPLTIMSVAVDGVIHQHPDYVALEAASEVHLVPRIAGGTD
jgi:molybdopterin converting factor small subunit